MKRGRVAESGVEFAFCMVFFHYVGRKTTSFIAYTSWRNFECALCNRVNKRLKSAIYNTCNHFKQAQMN